MLVQVLPSIVLASVASFLACSPSLLAGIGRPPRRTLGTTWARVTARGPKSPGPSTRRRRQASLKLVRNANGFSPYSLFSCSWPAAYARSRSISAQSARRRRRLSLPLLFPGRARRLRNRPCAASQRQPLGQPANCPRRPLALGSSSRRSAKVRTLEMGLSASMGLDRSGLWGVG